MPLKLGTPSSSEMGRATSRGNADALVYIADGLVDHDLCFPREEPIHMDTLDRQSLLRGTLILLGIGVSREPCFEFDAVDSADALVVFDYRAIEEERMADILQTLASDLTKGRTVLLPFIPQCVAYLDRIGLCPDLVIVSTIISSHVSLAELPMLMKEHYGIGRLDDGNVLSYHVLVTLFMRLTDMEREASLARNWEVKIVECCSFTTWVDTIGAIKEIAGLRILDGKLLMHGVGRIA